MQKNYKTKITFFIVFFGFLLFKPETTSASIIDTLKQKITEKAEQIKNLEQDIFKFQKELTNVAGEKTNLQTEVKKLDTAKKQLDTNIVVTENNIKKTGNVISNLEKELEQKEESLNLSITAIKKSLREIQLYSSNSIVENLLSQDSLSDVSNIIDQDLYFRESVKNHANELITIKSELEKTKTDYENKKTNLSKQQRELAGQKTAVLTTKQEKDRLLAETKNKEAEYQKLLAEKIKQKEQFEKEMFQFESELKIAIDPSKLPAVKAGVFAWPLESVYITQYFGATVAAKRLYVSGSHNGIDLRASDGTKVMAGLSGTVWATGNTDIKKGCYSYGKWILIKHENGLSTLYGHLSSQVVKAGDTVTTGSTIGYSGRTGYVTGPHLHFTVLATEGTRVMEIPAEKTVNCRGITIPIADPKAYLDPMLYLPKI